jgi:ribonuclease VapC
VILDTSAVMAMLLAEPEDAGFEETATRAEGLAMSAATHVELSIVTGRHAGPDIWPGVDDLLRQMEVEIIPFTAEHAALARDGWRRFGKGRQKAGLNFGDCFAYALAKHRDQPLLYKGRDFALTDVKAAI